ATTDSSASRLHLVGARSRFVDIDNTHRIFTVGIRLAPGMIPAFARIAASDLTDMTVPLDAFVERASRVQRSFDALGPTDSSQAINSLVASLLRTCHDPHPNVRLFDAIGGVADAARAARISERALRGWSPKHLG